MRKYTSEEIVGIMRRFRGFEVNPGDLDAFEEDDQFPTSIRSYTPGSFTRDLLELIEHHMRGEEAEGE